MTETVTTLVDKIRALEIELEAEMAKGRAGLRYGLERGRVIFEQEVLRRHKEQMTRLRTYLLNARPLVALTAPVIYSLIIPFVVIDVWVMLYQAICFPAYGIEKVRRRDCLVFDRQYLAYLNGLEKFNCAYCSYVAGVIAFVREVAARTEQYWCPIKHARKVLAAHGHYRDFLEFGDAEAYRAWIANSAAVTPPK
jgi:hypothetical protein